MANYAFSKNKLSRLSVALALLLSISSVKKGFVPEGFQNLTKSKKPKLTLGFGTEGGESLSDNVRNTKEKRSFVWSGTYADLHHEPLFQERNLGLEWNCSEKALANGNVEEGTDPSQNFSLASHFKRIPWLDVSFPSLVSKGNVPFEWNPNSWNIAKMSTGFFGVNGNRAKSFALNLDEIVFSSSLMLHPQSKATSSPSFASASGKGALRSSLSLVLWGGSDLAAEEEFSEFAFPVFYSASRVSSDFAGEEGFSEFALPSSSSALSVSSDSTVEETPSEVDLSSFGSTLSVSSDPAVEEASSELALSSSGSASRVSSDPEADVEESLEVRPSSSLFNDIISTPATPEADVIDDGEGTSQRLSSSTKAGVSSDPAVEEASSELALPSFDSALSASSDPAAEEGFSEFALPSSSSALSVSSDSTVEEAPPEVDLSSFGSALSVSSDPTVEEAPSEVDLSSSGSALSVSSDLAAEEAPSEVDLSSSGFALSASSDPAVEEASSELAFPSFDSASRVSSDSAGEEGFSEFDLSSSGSALSVTSDPAADVEESLEVRLSSSLFNEIMSTPATPEADVIDDGEETSQRLSSSMKAGASSDFAVEEVPSELALSSSGSALSVTSDPAAEEGFSEFALSSSSSALSVSSDSTVEEGFSEFAFPSFDSASRVSNDYAVEEGFSEFDLSLSGSALSASSDPAAEEGFSEFDLSSSSSALSASSDSTGEEAPSEFDLSSSGSALSVSSDSTGEEAPSEFALSSSSSASRVSSDFAGEEAPSELALSSFGSALRISNAPEADVERSLEVRFSSSLFNEIISTPVTPEADVIDDGEETSQRLSSSTKAGAGNSWKNVVSNIWGRIGSFFRRPNHTEDTASSSFEWHNWNRDESEDESSSFVTETDSSIRTSAPIVEEDDSGVLFNMGVAKFALNSHAKEVAFSDRPEALEMPRGSRGYLREIDPFSGIYEREEY